MLRINRLIQRRLLTAPIQSVRRQSTYQPPDPPRSEQPNAHRNFYKEFGRPVARSFLIAVATYQILYYSWSKLESMEMKREKEGEMRALEGELRKLTGKGQQQQEGS